MRRLSRLATACMAACLLSLAAVTVGGAVTSLRTGDGARLEVDLSGAYGGVQSAVLLAIRSQRRAADAPTPAAAGQARVDYERAGAELAGAIQRVRDLGGPQDRAIASNITIDARKFDRAARPLMRDGAARSGAQMPPNIVAAMDTLEALVTAADGVHRANASRVMAKLAEQQRRQALTTIGLLVLSSACLAACWLLLLVLQRDLRRQAAEHRHRADHDALTGLLNRGAFRWALDAALRDAAKRDGAGRRDGVGWRDGVGRRGGVAVLLLDLNGFKPVNDTHGHDAGDEVLCAVAGRLREELRGGDLAGRLGGDEFAVLLTGANAWAVAVRATRLRERLAEPYPIGSATVRVTASIGRGISPADGTTAHDLLCSADRAMYRDKYRGGSAVGDRTSSAPEPSPSELPLAQLS